VVVYTENYEVIQFQFFSVNFIDKYNTSIINTYRSYYDIPTVEVIYNCGEMTMDYIVSDFLNGPNYNLTVVEESASPGNNKSKRFFDF
jgi:hypothetical protein